MSSHSPLASLDPLDPLDPPLDPLGPQEAHQSYEFSEEERQRWNQVLQTLPIPDPNEQLIKIYESDTLVQAIGIRAEKWDSPEWRATQEYVEILKEAHAAAEEKHREAATSKVKIKVQGEGEGLGKDDVPIPRNLQNPNFTKLLELLEELRSSSSKSVAAFEEFYEFIQSLGVTKAPIPIYQLNWLPDPRYLRLLLGEQPATYFLAAPAPAQASASAGAEAGAKASEHFMLSLVLSYFHKKYLLDRHSK